MNPALKLAIAAQHHEYQHAADQAQFGQVQCQGEL